MLYIVGTPIGNMADITYRAVETLKNVQLIAAEDTRQTAKLLAYYGIATPLTSYHEHNKAQKGERIIEKLKSGIDVALVSDAGMPCISDPGCELVKSCIENNVDFTVVPGPCAFVTGLVLSGLKTQNFKFVGFLSVRNSERAAKLEQLKSETETLIFYEAPHKLLRTLKDFEAVFGGDRSMAACRELTKKFEEIKRGTVSELRNYFENNPIKGEFVLVVDGAKPKSLEFEMSVSEHVETLIKDGMDKKSAISAVAKQRGIPKKEVYNQVLYIKGEVKNG